MVRNSNCGGQKLQVEVEASHQRAAAGAPKRAYVRQRTRIDDLTHQYILLIEMEASPDGHSQNIYAQLVLALSRQNRKAFETA